MTASPTGFVPGDGFAIVTDVVLMLLGPEAGDLVPDLHRQLAVHADVDVVLDALASTGLRHLRDFAIAVREPAGTRVIVRGEATAWLGTVRIDGAGLRTWNERVVAEPGSVWLALNGNDPGSSIFEVERGLVPATALTSQRSFDSAPADEAEQSPADAPTLLDEAPTTPVAGELPGLPDLVPNWKLDIPSLTFTGADAVQSVPAAADDAARAQGGARTHDETPAPSPYDDLYGHTVHRSVQQAAMLGGDEPPAGAASEPAPEVDAGGGDHDGHTISAATLRELHRAEASGSTESGNAALGDHDGHTINLGHLRALRGVSAGTETSHASGPIVQALVCPAGHPNPTHVGSCRTCGSPLPDLPTAIPRPVLGRLRLSIGDVIELDRPIVIGRNPRIGGNLPGELPRLVRLEAFHGLSRSHAMVRLEGWQALLVDLGSANHTTVTVPGRPPRRLHADEPMLLTHGASIDLAGEVTAIYDAGI